MIAPPGEKSPGLRPKSPKADPPRSPGLGTKSPKAGLIDSIVNCKDSAVKKSSEMRPKPGEIMPPSELNKSGSRTRSRSPRVAGKGKQSPTPASEDVSSFSEPSNISQRQDLFRQGITRSCCQCNGRFNINGFSRGQWNRKADNR